MSEKIEMHTEYSQTDNGYIAYYKSALHEAVVPIDRNDPYTPGMGTVTPLGATGFGSTKRAAFHVAKHAFKAQFQHGTTYRPKGDISVIFNMPPIWDWASSKSRDVVFEFEVYDRVVYAQMRKFSKHPSIKDWVVVNRRFEDVSPTRAKQILRAAMRAKIEALKEEVKKPEVPVSFPNMAVWR